MECIFGSMLLVSTSIQFHLEYIGTSCDFKDNLLTKMSLSWEFIPKYPHHVFSIHVMLSDVISNQCLYCVASVTVPRSTTCFHYLSISCLPMFPMSLCCSIGIFNSSNFELATKQWRKVGREWARLLGTYTHERAPISNNNWRSWQNCLLGLGSEN